MAHNVPSPVPAGSPAPQPAPLPAWVTPGPGQANVVCVAGVAACFVGDFDRTNVVTESDAERRARITRPGAIVLANLDIDDPSPPPAPPTPPPDLTPQLDALNDVVDGPQDEGGLMLLKLRPPQPCAVVATEVKLVCDPADARRIRAFQVGFAGGGPQLGAGSSGRHELRLPTTPNFRIDYRLEALTLAGDPTLPAPSSAPPRPPVGLAVDLPQGASATQPIYRTRAPGEIWLELQHNVVPRMRPLRDVALVTIAPWIMLSNLQPVQRLFFVYIAPEYDPAKGLDAGNHDFACDIAEACAQALGTPPVRNDSLPLATSSVGSPDRLYLINGSEQRDRTGAKAVDQWTQDELEIGYCWAPNAWMHVTLHNPRGDASTGSPLADFVKAHLAAPGMGVFYKLPEHGDSLNFGGNLEVSPPVTVSTPRLARDGGGPTVRPHPPAPFGKILIGDCTPRAPLPELHDFLVAQKVQPVLPLDTSWLKVGHIDEIMSFVKGRGRKGFKLLFASVRAMDALLAEVRRAPHTSVSTGFHAGMYGSSNYRRYIEQSADELLHELKSYNAKLRTEKLNPIQQRFERGLGLARADILPMPTYFELPDDERMPFGHDLNQTIAHTVGSVNMQVVGRHLLVPRPFGSRMTADAARRVVEATMAAIGWRKPVIATSRNGFYFWARAGQSLSKIATAFALTPTPAHRANIVEHLRDSRRPLSPDNVAAVADARRRIETSPQNTAGPNRLVDCLRGDQIIKMKKLWIPHDSVDVMEVYLQSVLEAEGNTVHFIDDWYVYHRMMGEVHCATNVVRTPPELDPNFTARWWDHYDPSLDHDYAPGG